MKWFLALMCILAVPSLASPPLSQTSEGFAEAWETPLLGAWLNDTGGDRVGLDLRPKGECSLSIERALRNRSDRDCTYEPFEDRYLIFLMDDHGQCDGNADFEFIFHPELPLITLLVGSAQIYMNRLQP